MLVVWRSTWMLGTKLGYPGKAGCALNCRANPPAPEFICPQKVSGYFLLNGDAGIQDLSTLKFSPFWCLVLIWACSLVSIKWKGEKPGWLSWGDLWDDWEKCAIIGFKFCWPRISHAQCTATWERGHSVAVWPGGRRNGFCQWQPICANERRAERKGLCAWGKSKAPGELSPF